MKNRYKRRTANGGPMTVGPAPPLEKIYREIALLKKLDHPNVVKLIEVLDDPNEDTLYMVFELMSGGESLPIPADKPLDEQTSRTYFRDALQGLDYCKLKVRDLKTSQFVKCITNTSSIATSNPPTCCWARMDM